ncbi:hypothetical protein GE21DRAFT_5961 [Neurospora crassa]|uniref:Uncharacterized protein n=1 Tax=Neurospora crassa (strain ATCC 24698 / 74-OR23-1A / CBS 708.71 / DSM 1257 / FGSC 987) TaxID=367110 RepID=Q7SAD2_NEUCR|nr:hypothetical protein NCU06298 [Neurospora crassa OR74A]EAA33324.1 hypothetical protein NCU06298 [Neurospora crassa OR74A]KHE83183.1 hypothetical protein GE21DRAFT_5961 [Neurospora crassa]|eukprot:XP_962560.1 hypothetical protein NCU06298 [Neurospora crassa OR74A]
MLCAAKWWDSQEFGGTQEVSANRVATSTTSTKSRLMISFEGCDMILRFSLGLSLPDEKIEGLEQDLACPFARQNAAVAEFAVVTPKHAIPRQKPI